jgi:hypothetical protein
MQWLWIILIECCAGCYNFIVEFESSLALIESKWNELQKPWFSAKQNWQSEIILTNLQNNLKLSNFKRNLSVKCLI